MSDDAQTPEQLQGADAIPLTGTVYFRLQELSDEMFLSNGQTALPIYLLNTDRIDALYDNRKLYLTKGLMDRFKKGSINEDNFNDSDILSLVAYLEGYHRQTFLSGAISALKDLLKPELIPRNALKAAVCVPTAGALLIGVDRCRGRTRRHMLRDTLAYGTVLTISSKIMDEKSSVEDADHYSACLVSKESLMVALQKLDRISKENPITESLSERIKKIKGGGGDGACEASLSRRAFMRF